MKNLFLAVITAIAVFGLYTTLSYGTVQDDPKSMKDCTCETCEMKNDCNGSCTGDMSGCSMGMSEFKKEPMKHSSGMQMPENTVEATNDDLCPVSGEPIGASKITYTYLGTEYKFCCAGCVAEFRSEPMDYVKEEIKCPVEGGAGMKEVSAMYDGTKYYFCCAGCDTEFMSKPEEYLEKMNSSSEK